MEHGPSLLSLGDSYTIGESVAKHQCWPVKLCDRLGFSIPNLIARTGWTTQELLEAIEEARIMHFHDYVTLLIGVNDQYQGMSLEQYSMEFEIVLFKAVALAQHKPRHVIVLSIPDYGITPFAQQKNPARIHDEINAFNAVNEDISKREKVHYVNITDISRRAGKDSSMLATDELHPSAKMYDLWVERIINQVFTDA